MNNSFTEPNGQEQLTNETQQAQPTYQPQAQTQAQPSYQQQPVYQPPRLVNDSFNPYVEPIYFPDDTSAAPKRDDGMMAELAGGIVMVVLGAIIGLFLALEYMIMLVDGSASISPMLILSTILMLAGGILLIILSIPKKNKA